MYIYFIYLVISFVHYTLSSHIKKIKIKIKKKFYYLILFSINKQRYIEKLTPLNSILCQIN